MRILFIILIILCSGGITWSVYRDMQIEKQYPGDLRNRVVGSRLQKDGRTPYFYKWKKEDGLRYYDPQNFDSLRVSNITATPFLHQLLFPIADLPQRSISRVWLLIEYIALALVTLIGILMATRPEQKLAVLVAVSLFLFSNAWTGHVAAGQFYILIPLLSLIYFYYSEPMKGAADAVIAALAASWLILIRPNIIVFLLPLALTGSYRNKKTRTLFAGLCVGLTIFLVMTEGDSWRQYRDALTEQVRTHQQLGPQRQVNEGDPQFTHWEGWSVPRIEEESKRFSYQYSTEHGNAFIILNNLLNVKTPVWLLACAASLLIVVLLMAFLKKYNGTPAFDSFNLAILAFTFYMITDIFSPVHRFPYNASQWLFPLVLVTSRLHRRDWKIYALAAAGIFLNSLNLSFLPFEQSLGEFLILLALLWFVFTRRKNHSE